MHTFKLKILTPDQKLFEGEVLSVTLPTQSGVITVLKKHEPLISILSIGEIKVHTSPNLSLERRGTEQEVQTFLVQGGVVDVKQSGEVFILADQKLDDENLNTEELNKSIERAKQAMKEDNSTFDYETFESEMERANFWKNYKK